MEKDHAVKTRHCCICPPKQFIQPRPGRQGAAAQSCLQEGFLQEGGLQESSSKKYIAAKIIGRAEKTGSEKDHQKGLTSTASPYPLLQDIISA